MKYKVGKKIFRVTFSLFLTAFLVLYFTRGMGYFEYENHKKATLTEKQIKAFEQDVADGKEVDVKDYLPEENNDFQNSISSAGLKVSTLAEDCVKSAVEGGFKALAKIVGT